MWFLLAFLLCVGPVVLIGWGWMRWVRWSGLLSWTSALSLAGFVLATCSLLLEIGSAGYAIAIGGFRHYDPRLMRIFAIGLLVSSLGLVLSIAGIWNRNPIRWHAATTSLTMALVWLFWASME